MKALRIIPVFLLFIGCTYVGMLFVEANRTEVIIQFGSYQSPSVALGFVVLTSVLVGMCIAGLLCSIELVALFVQFKRLQRSIPEPHDMATTTEKA